MVLIICYRHRIQQIVILSGSVGHRGEPTNSCVWLKLCHSQCSREVSGSASVCPFSSWIPALGCLISLGLTQTCSLCSLHTLSARWFVRIHGIWAHSVCFGKWSIAASQDAKMLIGSSSRMSVCHPLLPPYAVAQMLVHMFQLVTLCVCAHGLLFMYVFLLFYRGIQHQYSGKATTHHWLGSRRLGLSHRCGRHHHRV